MAGEEFVRLRPRVAEDPVSADGNGTRADISRISGRHAKMPSLPMPTRGDVIAKRWWLLGVAMYFVLALTLPLSLIIARPPGTSVSAVLRELFGIGEQQTNVVLMLLVVGGIGLWVLAMIYVRRDIESITEEEEDVEWVARRGADGVKWIFYPPAIRERHYGKSAPPDSAETQKSVDTLLDHRVRRVEIVRDSDQGGSVGAQELRLVAETQMSQLGSFARFASSLLLLIAVLGTFAGVKAALPSLIVAVGKSGDDMPAIANALQAVAAAFGGNAFALIGAISVSLMLQGVSLGRANLLRRLELVSDEFVYPADSSAQEGPMMEAISAFRRTASELDKASGAMLGMETAMSDLSGSFDRAFERLSGKLESIVEHQEEGLYEKTAKSLDLLNKRVSDLAVSVQNSALVAAQVGEAVKTRSKETEEILRLTRATGETLHAALGKVVTAGEASVKAADKLMVSSASLATSAELSVSQLSALNRSVSEVATVTGNVREALAQSEDRANRLQRTMLTAWESGVNTILGELQRHMQQALRAQEENVRSAQRPGAAVISGGGAGGELTEVMRRLERAMQDDLRQRRRDMRVLALGGLGAVVVGIGAVFFFVWLAPSGG
jgi:hypothetical protein